MRCEVAERELSARLDGEDDLSLRDDVQSHLAGCDRCGAFVRGAQRIRELTRLEEAPEVPDLVSVIMRDVGGTRRPVRAWARDAAVFVAAACVSAVALVGLPGIRRGPPAVHASAVAEGVLAQAAQVEEFSAGFEIVERNFAREVGVRRFRASIGFRAPEELRWVVRDLTRYPSEGWPRNEVTLAVDGGRWSLDEPVACPREALPGCPGSETESLVVRGREPFDPHVPLPADMVLPVRTLVEGGRMHVVGDSERLGRSVVTVELSVRDARPLLATLQAGGAWRPLFAGDRVRVELDRETWFPLAFRILVGRDVERDAWAARNGLPHEEPGSPVLDVAARWFRAHVPIGWEPGIPRGAATVDRGFRDVDWERIAEVAGFEPARPARPLGLARHRAGLVGSRREAGVLTSYASGSSWLVIREVRGWSQPAPFGEMSVVASPVRLGDGGIAYHEPPVGQLARRLSIHSRDRDLLLTSNLPLRDLLDIASSLGVSGERIPEEWRVERVPGGTVRHGISTDAAAQSAPFMSFPRRLPPEYRLWSVALETPAKDPRPRAVTTLYRRSGGEFEGEGLRLHEAVGNDLPPPTDPGALAVEVREGVGRYSPLREELEWVEGGVYRSLKGPGLGVAVLVDIAESLAPAREVLR